MEVIPVVLNDLAKWLNTAKTHLSITSADGRLNSALNEGEIINYLQNFYEPFYLTPKGYRIDPAQARQWYDFVVVNNDETEWYPINIKVTETTSADNLNCKLGVYYALTGLKPHFGNEVSWEKLFAEMSKNARENDKDYYFLVVNKNIGHEAFIATLKSLQEIQANGNNLPFQCRWNNNKKPILRNYRETKKFLLACFGESVKKRADAYLSFLTYFPEYA